MTLLKVFTTEFEGTIREAIFLEKQLRSQVRETTNGYSGMATNP